MALVKSNDARTATVLVAAAALATLCFALLGSSATREATALGAGCGPHVDSTPAEASKRQLKKAVRCLINQERNSRDRRTVRKNRALNRIAQRHSKVMVAEDCFTHQCPGERPLRKRIASSDYMAEGGRFGYGETLGCSRTPHGMVAEWMQIRFHRKNILDRSYRHIGVGAKRGSPFPAGGENCAPGRQYMTYAVIFAWRKRAD